MAKTLFFLCLSLLCLLLSTAAWAQKGPETTLTALPVDHPYQKTLRQFMAKLTTEDFAHGVSGKIDGEKAVASDPDVLYRHYLLTLMHQPLVGTKRGTPAINAPPVLFTLASIETPKGVMPPPVWPETLISFVQWDHPGNLYRNSRALKLRAFVGATVMMVMFHQFAEQNDGKVPPPIRPDWHGYNLVWMAASYPGFKDVLPEEVQKAYESGLKMVGERVLGWGVRGESCESDLMAPLGLVYVARALNDEAFTKKVEERVRMICTDERYFHKAGYWNERGGPDIGFGGAANLYASWIALMTDWPFVTDAIERTYRLRAHLIFPEPDGKLVGPTHFNARLGSYPLRDQFDCDGARDVAASMLTDEAMAFTAFPTDEVLRAAPARRAYQFNEDIGENPRDSSGRHLRNDEIANSYPWKLRMWQTYNFPISLNPAYEFYRKGSWAKRDALEKKRDAVGAMVMWPVLRRENYVRNFENEFFAARQPGYAALLHTGPIGDQRADDNKAQFKGPLGLGGGQLSAFWTPATGCVLLGLRSGMSYDKTFDAVDAWRTWPNHSISGITAQGAFFTSARTVKPAVKTSTQNGRTRVEVSGVIPKSMTGQDRSASGHYEYSRVFEIGEHGVSIESTIKGDGAEQVAELYEVLPVFLRDTELQPKAAPTTVEFQIGGAWVKAGADFSDKVTAVRLTRFEGGVVITFDAPRRAKLSPVEWSDTWFTKATSRNVLIDLLETADKPAAVSAPRVVKYSIAPR